MEDMITTFIWRMVLDVGNLFGADLSTPTPSFRLSGELALGAL